MELETSLGTLRVQANKEPGYPGFFISLVRPDGNTFDPVYVEVNEYHEGGPRLMVYQWTPENMWDKADTTHSYTPQRIDRVFEEVAV